MASNPEPPPSELPPFHQTFLPILKELSDGAVKDRKAIQSAVQERHYAHLPKELLQERTSTGSNRLFDRIRLGISYLRMAAYLEKPNRGQYRIVDKGRGALQAGELSLAELKEQPEFRAYESSGYFINKARDAEQEGALEAAIEWYSKAINLNPGNAGIYVDRGVAKFKLKQYAEAFADYDRAIILDPNHAGAYYNRGLAKAELNEYEAAIDDYDRAIELKPDYADAYYYRGNAKAKLNEYEAAIDDYDKAIELNPRHASAYYNRGNAKAKLNEYEAAIDDYDKAIKIKPNDPESADAYYNRGNAKAELNEYVAAISDYDRAIELKPDCADAYYNRGMTYRKLGQEAKAIQDFKKAQDLDPTVISKEGMKPLEKDVESIEEKTKAVKKDIESIGKKTESVENFQEVLSDLEEKFFLRSLFYGVLAVLMVLITAVLIGFFIFEPDCLFENLGDSQYRFWRVSSLIAFFVALTFYILGQHNKVANLRIDANNRLAMAKLLAHIEREHKKSGERDWHDRDYASLIDAIVYRIEFKKPKAAGESMVQRVIDGVSDGLSKKG